MGHEEEEPEKGYLPLFVSPLIERHDSRSASQGMGVEPKSESTVRARQDSASSNDNERTVESEGDVLALQQNPAFRRHAEASNAELFYDLFFVANLTVFSTVKEINDTSSLSQYVGFFCILWFTWYQVSLYDVRFSTDSVFERIAKLLQFGVMIGMAIVGPNFDVTSKEKFEEEDEGSGINAFKSLSLILMASRLVLVGQYLQSLWFTRGYKAVRLPMLTIAATEFVAALIYFGLFFSFGKGHVEAYIVWYIVAGVETMICTAISSYYRVVSFKGTHLVQRMSLLTLIILGEGVMMLAEKATTIVQGQIYSFAASTIGNIVCCVCILYFFYMMYFDWISEEHMGTIRQQIWSFLHFPLHLCLVLGLEGTNQFVGWRAAYVVQDGLSNQLVKLVGNYNETTPHSYYQGVASSLSDQASDFYYYAQGVIKGQEALQALGSSYDSITEAVTSLNETKMGDVDDATSNTAIIILDMVNMAFRSIGFAPEVEESSDSSQDPASAAVEQTESIVGLAKLIYIYTFAAIGFVCILTGVLAWMGKRHKHATDRLRLIVHFVIGTGLCLMPLMVTTYDAEELSGPFADFIASAWVLPLITICLVIIIVLNNVPVPDLKLLRRKSRGYRH